MPDQVELVLTFVERAVDEAERANDEATAHAYRVMEQYGEDSDEYRAFDGFAVEVAGFLDTVRLEAEAVRRVKP